MTIALSYYIAPPWLGMVLWLATACVITLAFALYRSDRWDVTSTYHIIVPILLLLHMFSFTKYLSYIHSLDQRFSWFSYCPNADTMSATVHTLRHIEGDEYGEIDIPTVVSNARSQDLYAGPFFEPAPEPGWVTRDAGVCYTPILDIAADYAFYMVVASIFALPVSVAVYRFAISRLKNSDPVENK